MSNEVEFNSLAGKDEVKVKLEQPSSVPRKPSDEEVAKYSKTRIILVVLFGLIIIGMIVAAVIIIIVAPKCVKAKVRDLDQSWLKHEIVYQVSPSSFRDTNGDGKGDLKGLIEKLDYLEGLGVKVLRLTPVFSDEDCHALDKAIGNMTDFDELVKKAKDKKIRIILDFVPNHTSNKNKWFKASNENKTSSYRNWYVWKDSPNNWPSKSGGSAWEKNSKTNQVYLHQFAVDQPDLNYREQAVVEAMSQFLKAWSDKGVNGFSASSVEYLLEDQDFRDDEQKPSYNGSNLNYDMTTHNSTYGLPENVDIVQKFRKTLDDVEGTYRALLVEISSVALLDQFYNKSDLPSFTGLANVDKAKMAESVNKTVMEYLAVVPDGKWPTFSLGGANFGNVLVDAVNVLLLTLPGTPMTNSGQELGMTGKWTDQDVKKQEKDSKSHYSVYRDVAKLRRADAFKSVKTKDIHVDPQVFAYLRDKKYLVVINFSSTEWDKDLPKISGRGVVSFDSKYEYTLGKKVDVNMLRLKGGQAVVVELNNYELL